MNKQNQNKEKKPQSQLILYTSFTNSRENPMITWTSFKANN